MKSAALHRPILLVHPDRSEAELLIEKLKASGVSRPILWRRDRFDACDYLAAAEIGGDERYMPCAVLLDEQLGASETQAFADWVRAMPSLGTIHLIMLTSETDGGRSAPPQAGIERRSEINAVAGILARACDF